MRLDTCSVSWGGELGKQYLLYKIRRRGLRVLLVCIKMGTSATTTCINKILRTTGLKLTSLFCELKAKLRVTAQDKTQTYVNDATAVSTQNSQFPERKRWHFQSASTSILRTLLRTYDSTSVRRLPLVTPTFQNWSSSIVIVEYCRAKSPSSRRLSQATEET